MGRNLTRTKKSRQMEVDSYMAFAICTMMRDRCCRVAYRDWCDIGGLHDMQLTKTLIEGDCFSLKEKCVILHTVLLLLIRQLIVGYVVHIRYRRTDGKRLNVQEYDLLTQSSKTVIIHFIPR